MQYAGHIKYTELCSLQCVNKRVCFYSVYFFFSREFTSCLLFCFLVEIFLEEFLGLKHLKPKIIELE